MIQTQGYEGKYGIVSSYVKILKQNNKQQVILYDNLKSVFIKRAFKQIDSEFNKRFLEFSGFYGFKPILARPYRPQTKGKVESTVRHVREDFFQGQEFRSLREMNLKAKQWLKEVNERIHHSTHERPTERLKKESLIPAIRQCKKAASLRRFA